MKKGLVTLYMEENGCCAAKDYLRDYYSILDSMMYGMTHAPQTDSVSYNFTVQMIPLCRAAAEMSERFLDCSDYLPLREVAKEIIRVSQRSIALFEKLRGQIAKIHSGAHELCVYDENYRRITEVMFKGMRCADVIERINCDFVREMIPQCTGTLGMCENALGVGVSPCLLPVIEEIADSSRRGIEQMQRIKCVLECM